jgi:hypothetical protein
MCHCNMLLVDCHIYQGKVGLAQVFGSFVSSKHTFHGQQVDGASVAISISEKHDIMSIGISSYWVYPCTCYH